MKTPTISHGRLEWHKRYDNIDGTGEMLMGLMVLRFGLLGYLQSILPKDSIWRTNFLCGLLFMYGVLFLVLGPGYWVRRVIKRRITFPRTGYVAGHSLWRPSVAATPAAATAEVAPGVPTRKALWLTMLAIAGFAALVGAGMVGVVTIERRHLDSMGWLAGAGYVGYLGFWVALYAFLIWQTSRQYRWKWLVLLGMAVGLLVIGLTGPGNYIEGARPVMLFVGAVWVGSGVGTLLAYLRQHRLPAGEGQ